MCILISLKENDNLRLLITCITGMVLSRCHRTLACPSSADGQAEPHFKQCPLASCFLTPPFSSLMEWVGWRKWFHETWSAYRSLSVPPLFCLIVVVVVFIIHPMCIPLMLTETQLIVNMCMWQEKIYTLILWTFTNSILLSVCILFTPWDVLKIIPCIYMQI